MARKREGFVPIGDLVIDLPGVPVPTRRAAAPQARHHFTQLDQVMQLVARARRTQTWVSWRGCSRCAVCRAATQQAGRCPAPGTKD